jgi:hypothetical protein
VGLALSGGGIRSATFNLGLLQGLAGLGLLHFFDFLSTVSGGGYIGGWLSAWIKRGGGTGAVQKELQTDRSSRAAGTDEAGAIRHLRRYSNYLAPRQGFLSADDWVLWASYLRNFLLNQLVLLPATVAVLLLVRLVMLLYYPWSSIDHDSWSNADRPSPTTVITASVVAVLVLVCWVPALVIIIRAALDVRPREQEAVRPDPRLAPGRLLFLTLTLLLGAVLFCSVTPTRCCSGSI